MTNREFIDSLTDEELADCIVNDDFLNIACLENRACIHDLKDCVRCVLNWPQKDVEDLTSDNISYNIQSVKHKN